MLLQATRHEQGGPPASHPDLVPVTDHSELTQQMFPKWSGSKTPTGGHSPGYHHHNATQTSLPLVLVLKPFRGKPLEAV